MTNTMKRGALFAALWVASTAVQAQGSHIPATLTGVTVAGVWSSSGRMVSGTVGRRAVGRSASLPASRLPALPAETPPSAASTVRGVLAADVGVISTMTSTLRTAGLGDAAGPLVSALAQLGGTTQGSRVNALRAWNVAATRMTTSQMRALLSTPEGVAAVRLMKAVADQFMGIRAR